MNAVLILVACLALYDCGKGRPPVPTPIPTPSPTVEPEPTPPTPSPAPCAADGDVTVAILAAITAGKTHSGGGCIRTQLIVKGALRLGAGIYQVVKPILVKSGGSIAGTGWDTVITESSTDFTVIGAHDATLNNGATDSNITLRNFKVAGSGAAGHNSAPQAISLGNCHGCTVDALWVDRTRSIGIQLGGANVVYPSRARTFAADSKITNNLLTRVASQAIAVVNGENIEISGNRVLRPGQAGGPGNTSIDLEVNGDADRLINIRVTNNVIDHRGSEMPITGNGIIANSGGSRNVSGVVIDSNTITGGNLEPATNILSNGIMVFGNYMTGTRVTNNKITRTGQTGIWLGGDLIICEDNQLDSVGGGGTEGFRIQTSNSTIRRNTYKCAGGICDGRMTVQGDGNLVEDNPGWTVKAVIQSKNSLDSLAP